MPAASYIYDLLRKVGLSDFGARTGEFLLVRPLKVLGVVLAALLVARLASRWVRRSVRSLQLRTALAGASARAEQRAVTIGEVLASLARAVVWAVAVLIVFDQLGINLAPLLAGAGIAGIALGFGAQSLVKDVLSGLFIIVEDQYGVGDTVNLGDASGTIEEVNLRVTRLRSVDGTVWYVPNGEIRRVANSSMEWSRALVDVVVPRTIDITTATAVMTDEATAFASEREWAPAILDATEMWGVETAAADSVTIRVVARTTPQQRPQLTRTLRTRLYARLARESGRPPSEPPAA